MVSCKYCNEYSICDKKSLPAYRIRQLIIADSFELFNDRFNALLEEDTGKREISVNDIMAIVDEVSAICPYNIK